MSVREISFKQAVKSEELSANEVPSTCNSVQVKIPKRRFA